MYDNSYFPQPNTPLKKKNMSGAEAGVSGNPTSTTTRWRFTYEAQSYIPTLRLLLFDSQTNPKVQCKNLQIELKFEEFSVHVSWFQDHEVLLRVPVPRVLLDVDSPLSFRAMDDHIEIKLVMLLSVENPIIGNLDIMVALSENGDAKVAADFQPLLTDSDLKTLSAMSDVHFFCRNCSTRLTKSPIRRFVEMPSTNWREMADNWFDACCCSFGGASEKLVTRCANSYSYAQGTCLLNSTSVILCKDDLIECRCPTQGGTQNSEVELASAERDCKVIEEGRNLCFENQSKMICKEFNAKHVCARTDCKVVANERSCSNVHCKLVAFESVLKDQAPPKPTEKKYFMDGFLGDVFMARFAHISKDVQWTQFMCPQCSSLLGAYPSCNGYGPFDFRIQLFKCYVSSGLPVSGSDNIFRKYTLVRMFTSLLVDTAKEELSFRTLVKDLDKHYPLLQIILLNPNSWCYSDFCSAGGDMTAPISRMDLLPVIKVLFSDCSNRSISELRMLEELATKDLAEEVYMFNNQIEELVKSLNAAKGVFPPSFTSHQGFSLSSLPR